MFRRISHSSGVLDEGEILFSTPFDYLFPDAARSPLCLLPAAPSTVAALRQLGELMADPGDPSDPMSGAFDSSIPAAFTYFGQFVDHDITARTDRNTAVSTIGASVLVSPQSPDVVVRDLRNGRRPQLDLDSVFGDGPSLAGSAVPSQTQSSDLYGPQLELNCFEQGGRVDLPRQDRVAKIADMRNDENVIIGQLQTAMLKFYNAILQKQQGGKEQKHVRARQLARWAYQFVVVNDFLPRICDEGIVRDTLANGPRFFGAAAGRGASFMPLEFSVAAYRYGHSMIRPFYELNEESGQILIRDLLGTSGNAENFFPDGQLATKRIVDWERFAGEGKHLQHARKIDTKIARGLFMLPFADRSADPVLRHLAQSNLLRGYSLSLPTAQAMCDGFGILPLSAAQLRGGEDGAIADLLQSSGFDERTPLWYYVLREAAVQQNGARLGELGSRIVCETLIGLLKQDPNSYLNNRADPAVDADKIDVNPAFGGNVRSLKSLLKFAGVLNP